MSSGVRVGVGASIDFSRRCGALAVAVLSGGGDPHRIQAALDDLTGDELRALAEATYAVPQYKAPGLLAWIDAACEWELNRRAGMHYSLAPPEAAIPEDEDAERFAGAQAPFAEAGEVRRLIAP